MMEGCVGGVEVVMKGMKKDRTGGSLQLTDMFLSYQMGDLQETERPAHSLFLWPAILQCLHPSFIYSIPPSPSSLLAGPPGDMGGI